LNDYHSHYDYDYHYDYHYKIKYKYNGIILWSMSIRLSIIFRITNTQLVSLILYINIIMMLYVDFRFLY